MRVADVLGAGERGRYLLAATFGNVHGVYAPGNVQLRPELLREGQGRCRCASGRALSVRLSRQQRLAPRPMRAAIANGVVKVNLDTDAQYAFTRAVADHVFANYDGVLRIDGGVGRKAAYDPRAWGARPRPRSRRASPRQPTFRICLEERVAMNPLPRLDALAPASGSTASWNRPSSSASCARTR